MFVSTAGERRVGPRSYLTKVVLVSWVGRRRPIETGWLNDNDDDDDDNDDHDDDNHNDNNNININDDDNNNNNN